MHKPIAESCLRNQQAIYDTLLPYLEGKVLKVFELGSGTGQHAVYIANQLPQLSWQPSDLESCLDGISQWSQESIHGNIHSPRILDVDKPTSVDALYDVVFTANTIHFVSEYTAGNVIDQASAHLKNNGHFFIYGPFKKGGEYTSEGDQRLDAWLKSRDPASGIRDRQWVLSKAENCELKLVNVHDMPANNFILVFQKIERLQEGKI